MGMNIEPLLWEGGGREEPDVPSFPPYFSGEGPQYEIDKRLWDEIGGCDIYVGMIWHRMGTPTGDWRSGTEAEFRGALRAQKETGRPSTIFFYQKTADPVLREVDPAQLEKAREFIAELNAAGVLHRFEDADDLEAQLHAHLPVAITKVRPAPTPEESPQPPAPGGATPVPPSPYFAHPYPLQPNFTGRVHERTMLTEWLTKDYQPPVLAVVAFGGMGKSALSWAWLQRDLLGETLPGAVADKPEDAEACRVPDDARPEGAFWWSFYERDSTFEGFLDRALAYAAGGQAPEGIDSAYDKMEALVNLLRERRLLLVLDGFERLLRQYASLAAVYQRDKQAEKIPAHERACADPNAATFLRRLAGGAFKSNILLTSRLFPTELEGDDGQPLANCRREDLTSLDPRDAVAFFHAEGVKGTRAEIEAACSPYGYHPLALRLLAGVIARDKRAPGDVQVAGRHPVLPELKGKEQHHILQVDYDTLDRRKRSLLSSIAAFRSPVDYEALSIFDEYKKVGEFDAALEDLIDRGLLLFDHGRVLYDLHPLVRAYAYERLADNERVHDRLREHFAAMPAPERDDVKSVEDLGPVIELYHHTVRAGRNDDARLLYSQRLSDVLYFRLGAYQIGIELLGSLFPEGEDRPPRLSEEGDQAWTLTALANYFSRSGQSRRAVPVFERQIAISETLGENSSAATGRENLARDRLKLGQLAAAEAELRNALDLSKASDHEFGKATSHAELGRLLGHQGAFDAARREFDAAVAVFSQVGATQAVGVIWAFRAQAAILGGSAEPALDSAHRAHEIATGGTVERDLIRANWLLGAALVAPLSRASTQRRKALAEAEPHLSEALRRCRDINMVDHEPDILLSWARWHRAQGHAQEALEHAQEALAIAERCEYRLDQADIHNFLAALALGDGDPKSAEKHATTAYERAWCDGPPHCYKPALDEAERLLTELGVEPPRIAAGESS